MDEHEKMLWMFKQVHGEDEGACYAEVYDSEEYPYDPAGVHLMKHGHICWSKSKVDLVFDFVTTHL